MPNHRYKTNSKRKTSSKVAFQWNEVSCYLLLVAAAVVVVLKTLFVVAKCRTQHDLFAHSGGVKYFHFAIPYTVYKVHAPSGISRATKVLPHASV